jgi:hypothetical protein
MRCFGIYNPDSGIKEAIKEVEAEARRQSFCRPVRDDMNLARHFSAGTDGMHGWSPVGTIEFIPKHIFHHIQSCNHLDEPPFTN